MGNTGSAPSPEKKESLFSSSKVTDPGRAPLSILVKITKEDGESLPYGEVSVELVKEIVQNNTGITPLEVLVLNDQDALVDLADGVSVMEITMAVHGEGRLMDQTIRVGCLISGRGRESLISMEKEREKYHLQKEDLEKEKLELEARERESRVTLHEYSI